MCKSNMTRHNKSRQARVAIGQDGLVCSLARVKCDRPLLSQSQKRQVAVADNTDGAQLIFAAKFTQFLRSLVERTKKPYSVIETVRNDYTFAAVFMCNNSWLRRAAEESSKCHQRLHVPDEIDRKKPLKSTGYILAPGLLYRKAVNNSLEVV